MTTINKYCLDKATIDKLGLRLSNQSINAQIALGSKVFEYPHIQNVFIMESDLYGNLMPEGTCFLAFEGQHGLIGRNLTIEKLTMASEDDIRSMVLHNNEG